MKKRWIYILGLIIMLLVVIAIVGSENRKLQIKLTDTLEQKTQLQEQTLALEEQILQLQGEKEILQEEKIELLAVSETLSDIDSGVAKRIGRSLSAYDMEVMSIWPIGEDTKENVKRFYVCDGIYDAEFYVADYITGKIYDLNPKTPQVEISYRIQNDLGEWKDEIVEHEVLIEDFDQNGQEDVLLVVSFKDRKQSENGGIFLWLQKDGEFLPLNKWYCGKDTEWMENDFSLQLDAFEASLQENQEPKEWEIDNVRVWIKEKLLKGRLEELSALLQSPKEKLHYTALREPEKVHTAVKQDKTQQYQVSIPENPYSEERINGWLESYYEAEEQEKQEVLAAGREEGETLNYSYNSGLWSERVDDAIISFMGSSYSYYGGAHGISSSFSVNFDTRSGRVLQLEDILWDKEAFCLFAMEYIESNYAEYGWGQEDVRDSMLDENWCLTGYGITIFLTGSNGLGLYRYEIPYEYLTEYIKSEFFPTQRAAEFDMYMGDGARMDVNGDGIIDILTEPVKNAQSWEIRINGRVSELVPEYEGRVLAVESSNIYSTKLVREDSGITKLVWKVSFYEAEPQVLTFVYLIEEEKVTLEAVYEED